MIIICPSCQKKFEADEDLIPDKGRLLKCGSCNETWFFIKNDQFNLGSSNIILDNQIQTKEDKIKDLKKNDKILQTNLNDIKENKGTELVKYKSKSSFTIEKILRYLIVSIITFIAAIIILDTFKEPLSIIFPKLELILYNLFETLRDLVLFVKDLS
tara:strand:- start:75 stop:545 length:471 start_codon:yes stop_codon:yes gene_type:complete